MSQRGSFSRQARPRTDAERGRRVAGGVLCALRYCDEQTDASDSMAFPPCSPALTRNVTAHDRASVMVGEKSHLVTSRCRGRRHITKTPRTRRLTGYGVRSRPRRDCRLRPREQSSRLAYSDAPEAALHGSKAGAVAPALQKLPPCVLAPLREPFASFLLCALCVLCGESPPKLSRYSA